jgi:GxxExxY protein
MRQDAKKRQDAKGRRESKMPYEEEIPPWGNLIEPPEELDRLAHAVIGAAIEVHRQLGPGLPEHAYQGAMEVELTVRGIPFERQKVIEIIYKGVVVAKGKIDLLVGGKLVVEIKSVDLIIPLFRLQTLSYMRIIRQPLGLLINFNVAVLREGIKRIIDSDQ